MATTHTLLSWLEVALSSKPELREQPVGLEIKRRAESFYASADLASQASPQAEVDLLDLLRQVLPEMPVCTATAMVQVIQRFYQAEALGFSSTAEMENHESWLLRTSPQHRAWVAEVQRVNQS